MALTRFPVADLVAMIPIPNGIANARAAIGHDPFQSVQWVAEVLGVDTGVYYRAVKTGLLAVQADVWAARAGFHPVSVWPDWPGELPECVGCGIEFFPTHDRHRYCRPQCRRGYREGRVPQPETVGG